MAISVEPPRGDVDAATLYFYEAPADGAEPAYYVDKQQGNISTVTHDVKIQDIRGRESEFNLDKDAFLVVQGVEPSAEKDFVDDASIEANYYPEVEKLILDNIPGSNKVVFFDHTVRRGGKDALRAPVQRVHIDQTATSAALRVRRHLPAEEVERLLAGRYRIVNVWRPLNKKPVESFPLAFASSSTLRDEDVVPVKHIYSNGYSGWTASIKHHPDQKWYYLSGMTGDERLLLECFDSEALKEGSGVEGGRLAHTAFADPRSRPDAEGRESIEVRTLVFGP